MFHGLIILGSTTVVFFYAEMPDLTQHQGKELCRLCLLHRPSMEAVALRSVSDLVPSKTVQGAPRCYKVLQPAWTLLLVLALVVVPSNLSGMPGTSRGP